MPAKKGAATAKTGTAKKTVVARKRSPPKKAVAAKKTATTRPVVKKAPQSMPYEQGKWAHVFVRAAGERRYWLIKSEPDVFSIDDLFAAPTRTTGWDSVRNSTARNFMRDAMKSGDLVFYYHSNAEPSAVVGTCEVVREGYPDPTALDPAHEYFDPASNPDTPTWFMVDVRVLSKFARPVSLAEIKSTSALSEMALVKMGRLSVVPVTPAEWETVVKMGARSA